VIDLSVVIGDPTAIRYLGVSPAEEVYRVKRIRSIEGQKSILDIDYLLRSKVPLLSYEVVEDSLYAYLENVLHLQIAYAKKIITVCKAKKEDQFYLQLPQDSYVVNVQSFTHLKDGLLFQYTESHHIIDRFQFVDYQARRIL
jgi:GntR family trehalose operon transcriptional repressor